MRFFPTLRDVVLLFFLFYDNAVFFLARGLARVCQLVESWYVEEDTCSRSARLITRGKGGTGPSNSAWLVALPVNEASCNFERKVCATTLSVCRRQGQIIRREPRCISRGAILLTIHVARIPNNIEITRTSPTIVFHSNVASLHLAHDLNVWQLSWRVWQKSLRTLMR